MMLKSLSLLILFSCRHVHAFGQGTVLSKASPKVAASDPTSQYLYIPAAFFIDNKTATDAKESIKDGYMRLFMERPLSEMVLGNQMAINIICSVEECMKAFGSLSFLEKCKKDHEGQSSAKECMKALKSQGFVKECREALGSQSSFEECKNAFGSLSFVEDCKKDNGSQSSVEECMKAPKNSSLAALKKGSHPESLSKLYKILSKQYENLENHYEALAERTSKTFVENISDIKYAVRLAAFHFSKPLKTDTHAVKQAVLGLQQVGKPVGAVRPDQKDLKRTDRLVDGQIRRLLTGYTLSPEESRELMHEHYSYFKELFELKENAGANQTNLLGETAFVSGGKKAAQPLCVRILHHHGLNKTFDKIESEGSGTKGIFQLPEKYCKVLQPKLEEPSWIKSAGKNIYSWKDSGVNDQEELIWKKSADKVVVAKPIEKKEPEIPAWKKKLLEQRGATIAKADAAGKKYPSAMAFWKQAENKPATPPVSQRALVGKKDEEEVEKFMGNETGQIFLCGIIPALAKGSRPLPETLGGLEVKLVPKNVEVDGYVHLDQFAFAQVN